MQYAIVSTMSCLNPLLVGETLEFVNETAKMMDHVAFKILHRYMKLVDLEDAAASAGGGEEGSGEEERGGGDASVAGMRSLLQTVFDDWDLQGRGFIDKPAFVHMVRVWVRSQGGGGDV